MSMDLLGDPRHARATDSGSSKHMEHVLHEASGSHLGPKPIHTGYACGDVLGFHESRKSGISKPMVCQTYGLHAGHLSQKRRKPQRQLRQLRTGS